MTKKSYTMPYIVSSTIIYVVNPAGECLPMPERDFLFALECANRRDYAGTNWAGQKIGNARHFPIAPYDYRTFENGRYPQCYLPGASR